MNEQERMLIINELEIVDKVFLSKDKDRSVCLTLRHLYEDYKNKYKIVFANGGDQNNKVCPELEVCKKLGIKLLDGLGDKIQSSSWLLKK